MKFVGDFHIHSKYSRACSPLMDLENLDRWAQIKGIKVMGTGDFTYPVWIEEIKQKLEPAESGLFRLKGADSQTRFILTTEISCIYTKVDPASAKGYGVAKKVRKVHIIIFAPSIEVVEKINIELNKVGNIDYDGRPILGLDARDLAKIVFNIDENCLVVPAHAWTPWFSVFGSKSGFDSLEECFEEYTKYIYAVETGLSADPKMFWRISKFDNITLLSNSDSHSAPKIGREANVFDAELSYEGIMGAIKKDGKNKLLHTIEFFPEEGKYHFDGHKDCKISFSPQESKKHKNTCPVCKRPLVIGVLNRVEELADRPEGFIPKNALPFLSLIPLQEIIAESISSSVASKKTMEHYNNLIKNLGNEFKILLDIERKEIEKFSLPEIAEGVSRVREGKVIIEPGYDGVYGKIKIFSNQEKSVTKNKKQNKLF